MSPRLMVSDMLKRPLQDLAQPRITPTSASSLQPAWHGKYKLDELDPSRIAKHLVMFQPGENSIVDVVAKARLSIPGIAETEEILRVVRHNPFCMLGLARKSKFNLEQPEAEGFVAVLPLNRLGLQDVGARVVRGHQA